MCAFTFYVNCLVDEKTLDDVALLALIEQRNEQALGVLYDRYNRLVMRIAFYTVQDWATAEEITLDVFTTVWIKAHSYRADRANVRTWLTRITRNRAIDILRRQNAPARQGNNRWQEVVAGDEAEKGNPEQVLELALLQQRVRAAMATLPEAQKEALFLVYFRGYSHSEAAGALNEPLGTIKTRIRAAMQKLRRLIVEEEQPEMEKSNF